MGPHRASSELAVQNGGDVRRLDRAGWAWEWLRHNPAYRREAGLGTPPARKILRQDPEIAVLVLLGRPAADRWGLLFQAPPDRPAEEAAVFWSGSANPRS